MKDTLLSRVNVAKPCPKRWCEMSGGDTSRFCQSCAKSVHNLSAMTASQAEALLRGATERICVAYLQDAQGRVITLPEPTPLSWPRMIFSQLRSALAGIIIAAAGVFLCGCAGTKDVRLPASQPWTPPEKPDDGMGLQPDGTWIIRDSGVYLESHNKPPHKQGTKRE